MKQFLALTISMALLGPAYAQIPLLNADIESNSSGIFGAIDDWGPNGGWADHQTFTIDPGRFYDPVLGLAFGFYSTSNDESVGQRTSVAIAANTAYSFASWAQGGGNDDGEIFYEIGYADGAGDFQLLASESYRVGRDWALQAGVEYMSGGSGPEIGQDLWVRLGPGPSGTPDDVWYDNFVATPEPASMLLLLSGGLFLIRKR